MNIRLVDDFVYYRIYFIMYSGLLTKKKGEQ